MNQEIPGFSTEPAMPSIGPVLQTIKQISTDFNIRSLDRQIAACEELFTENPLIDVAILGQFKAGKSSFINSLIGASILPVGVIPVTTVITRLSYGPIQRAVVTYYDGKRFEVGVSEIEEYISEAKNKANEKNVEVVDVELPSLRSYSGLRLVDTPGLGSIFKYNTEISEEWLPEVGAAIIAISSDRPLAENDLNLIRELMEFTPRVILMLTKVDLLTHEQQNEIVTFFGESLKHEFNKDFPILLYSTLKETGLYKPILDALLLDLSRNRDTEFKGIIQHKIRSLARQCINYLEIALRTSERADTDREDLKRIILDERVNFELMQTELSLVARENKQKTRELIANYLTDTHRVKLVHKLTARLSSEMPRWKGNLWKITRQYEEWLMKNMVVEMDHISRADYKHFFGTLRKAHSTISRSVELFRNLLDKNIEKVLGIAPNSVNWIIEVTEPAHPDVMFTKTFDFHFDTLWFLFPMLIFRHVFENHFLKQIPRVTDIHLSRLAYQWEVRINNTIDEIKKQALEYVQDELSTMDTLLSGKTEQTEHIRDSMMILKTQFDFIEGL